MKIMSIIGARPQFIKAGVVSKSLSKETALQEIILHTGQHFDTNMSAVFFEQLGMPRPDYLLNINGGTHGEMTGRMLVEIERVIMAEKPDRVLVYGDTNSTLAGALAAAKLHVPVAHVEAGLRSFNMKMPEEVNRILTDQVSDLLFCPTQTAVENLMSEGFDQKPVDVLNVGDVMQDSALMFAEYATSPVGFEIGDGFVLATLHRAENTDDFSRLVSIVNALNEINSTIAPVVIPMHPRTRDIISNSGLCLNAYIIDPASYLEMIWLLKHCGLVLTDSGGLQKEAFFFCRACVTMRDQTEWVELVELGANELVGADIDNIISAVVRNLGRNLDNCSRFYGDGHAAEYIADKLVKN